MTAHTSVTCNPLVSIVVPVYNIEPYVADAINSVIAQTVDNWELICIDDGSHDGSLGICRELAAGDERIFVVSQEHAGPGAARGHGASLARGTYVYFLDGDDMIVPDMLERCVRAAEEASADMVQFNAQMVAQDGAWFDVTGFERSREYPGVWNGAELYVAQCKAKDYNASPYLYLSRRELIAQCGGGIPGAATVFPPDIIHEDETITFRLLTGARRVVFLPDELYVRRNRPNSIMTARNWHVSARGYFRVYALAHARMSGRDPAQGWQAQAERLHLDLVASLCIDSFYRTGAPLDEFASVCDARAGDEAALESLLARRGLDPRLFRAFRRATLARRRLGVIKRRLMAMHHPGAGIRGGAAEHKNTQVAFSAGPKTAAVVATWNRKDLLRQCLDCILGQQGAACDVVVVDNGSTDGTSDMIAADYATPRVRYLNTGDNIGGAGGFMCGIEAAVAMGYDRIWIMDDDCIPRPTALAELLKADEHLGGRWGFLCSAIYWTDGEICKFNRPKKDVFRHVDERDYRQELVPVKMTSFVSVLFRADVVGEMGLPIAEYFTWTDDYEYTGRISKRHPSYAVPASKVIHAMRENARPSLATEDASRMGRFYYLSRNDVHCYRQHGAIGCAYLAAKTAYTAADVLLHARSSRGERLYQLVRGTADGLTFNPTVRRLNPSSHRAQDVEPESVASQDSC